ncbi:unnamed protein product [Auanema sp. JU1783]|nr:unnamed protein product [Auanema sp. JU1783]
MSIALSNKKGNKLEGWFKGRAKKRPRKVIDNTCFDSLPMCGLKVKFPQGVKLYPSQKLIITRIITAVNKKQNVLAESPTGSGKTLALLASSCAWIVNYNNQKADARNACPIHGLEKNKDAFEDMCEISLLSNGLNDSDPIILDSENETSILKPHIHQDEYDNDFIPSPMISKVKSKFDVTMDDPKKLECSCLPRVRIYYGTRTHKQIGQVVKEFSRLPYAGVIKHTILASREQYCINENVRQSADITSKCKETISNNGPGCMYKTNIRTFKMDQAKPLRSHIEQTGSVVFDIEELVSNLKEGRPSACPYFSANRILTQDADLIFCPFSYLVDPIIRNSSDVVMKNSIIILDEAHNIEDTCRDSASFTFYEKEIVDALTSLKQKENEVHESITAFSAAEGDDEVIKAKLMEYSKAYGVLVQLVSNIRKWFVTKATPVMKDPKDMFGNRQRTEPWAVIQDTMGGVDYRPPILLQEGTPEYDIVMESFHCFTAPNEEGSVELDHYKPSGVAIVLIEKWMYFQTYFSNKSYKTCYKLNITLEQIDEKAVSQNSFSEVSQSQGPKNTKYSDNAESVWLDSTTGPLGVKPIVPGVKSSFSFWCMSPEITFMDAFRECRSVVLASGTLCPTETLQTELGMDFKFHVEGSQVIDKQNIFAAILPLGVDGSEISATSGNLQNQQTLSSIVLTIESICETVPKGVLVFLPSYKSLKDLTQKMRYMAVDRRIRTRKVILEEPRKASELGNIMDQYFAVIKQPQDYGTSVDGALLFAVFRGKISEGIDFADDLARVVISIGIPYPYIGEGVIKEKKKYNSEQSKLGVSRILNGDQWYNTQAYRALNQALGRGLRHKNDWSALIMLDARLKNQLQPDAALASTRVSKWIRESSIYYTSYGDFKQSLERFVDNMLTKR